MSAHHPSVEVLAAYASGALADGPGLATATHLERCAQCRRAVSMLEEVGGALIEDETPVALDPQALDLALARIERPAAARPTRRVEQRSIGGLPLPRVLARRKIGPRRFVTPDLWIAHVRSNAPDGWRTYLVYAGKGRSLLQHGHQGSEFTAVIHGAFSDVNGRYGPGDFVEAGEDVSHRPKVEGDDPCLCLISAQGGVKAEGLGRLLRPLLQV